MAIRKEFRKSRESLPQDLGRIFLTQSEYDDLKKQVEDKKIELDSASKEIGEATQQSSETWHDNAPFDAAVENTGFLNKQYLDLLDRLQRAVVFEAPTGVDRVILGSKVTLLINFKTEKTFTISGISNPKEGTISLESPLGESIIGKKEGEESSFKVGVNESIVKIIKIFNESDNALK